MTTERGWLGFSRRWFRWQTPIDPVEVVDVGSDESDGTQIEVWSWGAPGIAGEFYTAGLEAQLSDVFVEGLILRGAPSTCVFRLGITDRLAGSVSLLGDTDSRWARYDAGGSGPCVEPWKLTTAAPPPPPPFHARLWGDRTDPDYFQFNKPGILVPQGKSWWIHVGNVSPSAWTMTLLYRLSRT